MFFKDLFVYFKADHTSDDGLQLEDEILTEEIMEDEKSKNDEVKPTTREDPNGSSENADHDKVINDSKENHNDSAMEESQENVDENAVSFGVFQLEEIEPDENECHETDRNGTDLSMDDFEVDQLI